MLCQLSYASKGMKVVQKRAIGLPLPFLYHAEIRR
jgi:hypothetical protein